MTGPLYDVEAMDLAIEPSSGSNTTRGVYRFPKRLIYDAWTTGISQTTEVIIWRLYGSGGGNWYDLVSGNDQCHNSLIHMCTTWAVDGTNDSNYDNTWDEVGASGT